MKKFKFLIFAMGVMLFVLSLSFNVVFAETNTTYTGGDESCTYVVELLDETQCKVTVTATNGDVITLQGSYLLEGELLQISAGNSVEPMVFVVGEGNTLEFYDDEEDIPEDNEEIIEEDKLTFGEMAKAFCDKWLQVIISGISGISGTALILWLGRKILTGIKNKIAESVLLNDEERKKNIQQLEEMEDTLDNAINKLRENDAKTQELLTNVENMSKDYKTLLENYDGMVSQVSEFKKLIALLISSNPDLASNGYAKKILETLDEGNDVE